jgi:hypothetical protein
MIKLTVTPQHDHNIYSLLIKKELALRQSNQGTLHASGPKKKLEAKWTHATYKGWIRFQQSLAGVLVAVVQSKDASAEWQLLTSFIGFLDRHFRDEISSITLQYSAQPRRKR